MLNRTILKPTLFAGILLSLSLTCSATAFAREVTVALLPFEVHAGEDLQYIADGMASLLPSRLSMPGKIKVIDHYVLKKALAGEKNLPSQNEKIALAKKVGADFVLAGSITKIGSNVSVDGQLIDVLEPANTTPVFIQSLGLDNVIPEISAFAQNIKNSIIGGPAIPETASRPAAPPAPARTPAADPEPVQETPLYEPAYAGPSFVQRSQPQNHPKQKPLFAPAPFMTHEIKTVALQTITTGDIDGDGKLEILLSQPDKVYVCKYSGTGIEKTHEIEVHMAENILDVAAADLNGNGRDELYVSCYEGHYANSFVIELKDEKFQRLEEGRKWFFRIYEHPRDGKLLIGQKADLNNPFFGELYQFHWKDDKLIYREEVILPGGLNIYGFTEVDMDNDGSTEYLGFNKGLFSQSYQLAVFTYTGRVKWRDLLGLGGTPRTFTILMHGENLEKHEPIPMRIISEDINQDGTLDVIVAKNQKKGSGIFKALSDYNEGNVMCLHWDGLEMVPNWTSTTFKEYVSDYTAADLDGDGHKELYILSVAADGFFGKAINTISGYKIAE